MGPWVGRIKDGIALVRGVAHHLPRPDKHSIHGLVRDLPWRVQEVGTTTAELSFDSREHPSLSGYPFPFRAIVRYSLSPDRYRTAVRVTNVGEREQPAGWGFHPYFPATMNGSARVRLRAPATGVFETEGVPIPERAPVPVPPSVSFAEDRELVEGFDTCFTEWHGEAVLSWGHRRLTLVGSPEMRHLVVFSPPGKPFVAVEPMTTVPNAVNLEANQLMPTGLAWLAPDESFEAWYDTVVG
jgi:aldose 1-epimerase